MFRAAVSGESTSVPMSMIGDEGSEPLSAPLSGGKAPTERTVPEGNVMGRLRGRRYMDVPVGAGRGRGSRALTRDRSTEILPFAGRAQPVPEHLVSRAEVERSDEVNKEAASRRTRTRIVKAPSLYGWESD